MTNGWCINLAQVLSDRDPDSEMMATGLDHSYDQEVEEKCEENFIKHDQIAFNKTVDGKEEENFRDELFKAVTLLVTSDGFAVQQEAVS